MTASYAACLYMKEQYAGKKVFVLGTPSFLEELKEFGIQVTEEADPDVACVLVGFDDTLRYEKLSKACELLFREGIEFLGPIRIFDVRHHLGIFQTVGRSAGCSGIRLEDLRSLSVNQTG